MELELKGSSFLHTSTQLISSSSSLSISMASLLVIDDNVNGFKMHYEDTKEGLEVAKQDRREKRSEFTGEWKKDMKEALAIRRIKAGECDGEVVYDETDSDNSDDEPCPSDSDSPSESSGDDEEEKEKEKEKEKEPTKKRKLIVFK